jgi:hypothetical protein
MKNEQSSFASEVVDQNDSENEAVTLANAYAALNCAYTGVTDVGLSFFAENN